MKTSVFVANGISAILILDLLLTSPAITGFAVAPKFELDPTSSLGLSIIFIITTIVLDVYFYLKTKKNT